VPQHRRRAAVLLAGLATAVVAAACGTTSGDAPGEGSGTATLFAAASLARVMAGEAAAFARAHPGESVDGDYEGSQQLLVKLQADPGVADLFISADTARMDEARRQELIGPPVVLAHNRMVIIVPRGNPGRVAVLSDLARPGLRLVVADPTVPAGAFTLRLFSSAVGRGDVASGFDAGVARNTVSREDNVEGVVTKVASGEVDAGVVYATDALATSDVAAMQVPERDDPITTYPAAVTRQARHARVAADFLAYLQSTAGQDILRRAGFLPP
jgi:molybdate transport system substrate-binding protein